MIQRDDDIPFEPDVFTAVIVLGAVVVAVSADVLVFKSFILDFRFFAEQCVYNLADDNREYDFYKQKGNEINAFVARNKNRKSLVARRDENREQSSDAYKVFFVKFCRHYRNPALRERPRERTENGRGFAC